MHQNLWEFMYRNLSTKFKEKGFLFCGDKPWAQNSEFTAFLASNKKRNIIFFFDELDALLDNKENKQDFLTTFRALRNDTTSHGLKAIVGIGVFALVPINTDSRILSPFNVKEAVKMDFFSLAETEELISSYSREYCVDVTKEVISALYDYTNGYEKYN